MGDDVRPGLPAEAAAARRIAAQRVDRRGQRVGVVGRHEQPGERRRRTAVPMAATSLAITGRPRGHRLEHHVRQPVAVVAAVDPRRHDDDVGGGVHGRAARRG